MYGKVKNDVNKYILIYLPFQLLKLELNSDLNDSQIDVMCGFFFLNHKHSKSLPLLQIHEGQKLCAAP